MNKELIFLCIALSFLFFSLISIFTAPIINNNDNGNDFSKWGKLNCQFYSDKEKDTNHIDELQQFKKLKDLCYRQKAMYNLEYSSFIIDIVLGFICSQFGLLLYFKLGSLQKISGIFGLIAGIICFILTFVYICYSGYIFNNDIAYKILDPSSSPYYNNNNMKEKLFSNGAKYKKGTPDIYPYQEEEDDNAKYIKYKDLGEKQYNYNRRYYETFQNTDCKIGGTQTSCNYIYEEPEQSLKNKYLYDNWVTSLFFSCLVLLSDIGLIIIGFLFMKNKAGPYLELLPNSETIQINKKK